MAGRGLARLQARSAREEAIRPAFAWAQYIHEQAMNGKRDEPSPAEGVDGQPVLYQWWLRKAGEVGLGHRCWCVYCLACYAKKCAIPYEQLHHDASVLCDTPTASKPDHSFNPRDVNDALKAYNQSQSPPITSAAVSNLTGLPLRQPPQRQKTKIQVELKVIETSTSSMRTKRSTN